MCGIAGLFDLHDSAREHDPAGTAQRMADAMPYRGPDGFGAWGDEAAGIGLAHRRLAIVDLTADRRAADALGRWPLRHHLQRRGL